MKGLWSDAIQFRGRAKGALFEEEFPGGKQPPEPLRLILGLVRGFLGCDIIG